MSKDTKISEAALIHLLKTNQKSGYEYLYDHYSAALYMIIHAIVYDEETASDLLQEVFIKVWKNIDSYDAKKGRLFTWMVNISRNLSIDKTRSKSFHKDRLNDSMDVVRSRINKIVSPDINTDHIGIMDFVTKLTHNEKVLVELAYCQGYSQSEISAAYDIPLGTVKSRLRSALVNLRAHLAERPELQYV